MVAMILLRALHKDISRYNAVDAQEDVQEDYGWKLVHGDVFRPPTRAMFLAVLVGNGAQLLAMAGVTLGKFTMPALQLAIGVEANLLAYSFCCSWFPFPI
jgi:Endomembrane protein 70